MMSSSRQSVFATSGVLARPAGLPCGALANAPGGEFGASTTKSQLPFQSTVSSTARPFGTAAVIAPPGWVAREAPVHPSHKLVAAGLDSVVDNTMRLKPLKPRYGKTREISPCELVPSPRQLATDLLSVTKGVNIGRLPEIDSPERMGSILAPYSPNASLFFNKFDPGRYGAGFLRSPTELGGRTNVDEAAASMKSMRMHDGFSPSSDNLWKQKKFHFDRTANLAHIPVVKATIRKPFGF